MECYLPGMGGGDIWLSFFVCFTIFLILDVTADFFKIESWKLVYYETPDLKPYVSAGLFWHISSRNEVGGVQRGWGRSPGASPGLNWTVRRELPINPWWSWEFRHHWPPLSAPWEERVVVPHFIPHSDNTDEVASSPRGSGECLSLHEASSDAPHRKGKTLLLLAGVEAKLPLCLPTDTVGVKDLFSLSIGDQRQFLV